LNGLAESAGEAFEVVTVSFDPREGPELAAEKKVNYLRSYRRATAAAGWHFLTGPQNSIDRLTRAVGFRYRWDAKNQVFAHATAIMVLTPGGKVSRYFYGVEAPPTDLHNAILNAGQEAVGRRVDEVLLYCFHYDPLTGRWGVIVSRLLQVLAGATVLCVGGFVWWQVARERRGSAVAAKERFDNIEKTLTPTLSRSTGRGGEGSDGALSSRSTGRGGKARTEPRPPGAGRGS
jgi:protein SCO1/2